MQTTSSTCSEKEQPFTFCLDTTAYPPQRSLGKRLFDVVFSLSVIIGLSPLFLVICLLIKTTSKGPIFFQHTRIKRSGKPFRCYKFRTMYRNSDLLLQNLLKKSPSLQAEWKTFFKLKEDPRITPFGKFLRKTSLDELPQFFNVLKGDLSVVGPRPVLQKEVIEYYRDKASKILSVKPGITGLWQVSGRNNLSMEDRVKLEESYIDKQSFWLDLLLIVKTIPAMIFSKGAY